MLELQSVCVEFLAAGGTIRPVDQVSLMVRQGERHVIIGETGSGKSVLLMSIFGAQRRQGNGTYFMERQRVGWPVATGVQPEPRKGDRIYPPGNASGFNPLMRIGTQIAEPLRVHLKLGRAEARAYAVDVLRRLDFQDPEYWASRILTTSAVG